MKKSTIEEKRNILFLKSEDFSLDEVLYKNGMTYCKCTCLKNQAHGSWSTLWRHLKNGSGCPKCGSESAGKTRSTPKYEFSIGNVRKDLVKYFKNQNEAYKYFPTSKKKIDLICPNCFTEKNAVTLSNLFKMVFHVIYVQTV